MRRQKDGVPLPGWTEGDSDYILAVMEILYPELQIGYTPVIVLHYGIADVYRIAGLDVLEMFRLVEGYCGYRPVWLGFLYQFQFQMASISTDFPCIAVIIYILRKKDRSVVAGSERLELLEYPEEFRSDLRKVQPGVYHNDRGKHFLPYIVFYEFDGKRQSRQPPCAMMDYILW